MNCSKIKWVPSGYRIPLRSSSLKCRCPDGKYWDGGGRNPISQLGSIGPLSSLPILGVEDSLPENTGAFSSLQEQGHWSWSLMRWKMHSGWQPWPWASHHARKSSAVHHIVSRWWASWEKRIEKHMFFYLIHTSGVYGSLCPSSNQELLIWLKLRLEKFSVTRRLIFLTFKYIFQIILHLQPFPALFFSMSPLSDISYILHVVFFFNLLLGLPL